MYVATRQLKISEPGEDGKTKVLTIDPGQAVPGAESWPYSNIVAHLNLHLIRWNGAPGVIAPHDVHKQRGLVVPSAPRAAATKAAYPTPAKDQEVAPVSKEIAAATPAPEIQAPPAPAILSCPECPGRTFKHGGALKAHAKSHEKDSK